MWWLPLAGSTVWKASNGLLITLSGWARVILTRPASTTLAISSTGHSRSAACTGVRHYHLRLAGQPACDHVMTVQLPPRMSKRAGWGSVAKLHRLAGMYEPPGP
jgi:hypothetical protein